MSWTYQIIYKDISNCLYRKRAKNSPGDSEDEWCWETYPATNQGMLAQGQKNKLKV